ncbi:hypothetical protein M0805_004180 [Coniferiporia weirii]|nr:hypothetical protein M0805_004180 [Coniferiporia weirii]
MPTTKSSRRRGGRLKKDITSAPQLDSSVSPRSSQETRNSIFPQIVQYLAPESGVQNREPERGVYTVILNGSSGSDGSTGLPLAKKGPIGLSKQLSPASPIDVLSTVDYRKDHKSTELCKQTGPSDGGICKGTRVTCENNSHASEPLTKSMVQTPHTEVQKQKRISTHRRRVKKSNKIAPSPGSISVPDSAAASPPVRSPPSASCDPATRASSLEQLTVADSDAIPCGTGVRRTGPNPVEKTSASSVSNSDPIARPLKHCWDWQKGKCSRTKCRYAHADPESGGKRADGPSSVSELKTSSAGTKPDDAPQPLAPLTLGLSDKARAPLVPKAPENTLIINFISFYDQKITPPPVQVASQDNRVQRTEGSVLALASIPPIFPEDAAAPDFAGTSKESGIFRPPQSYGNLRKTHTTTASNSKSAVSEDLQGGFGKEMTVTLLKSTLVTLGPGFRILNVTTGFESRYVLLGNLPVVITEQDVRDIALPFGDILKVDCRRPQSAGKGSTAKVQYADYSQAAAAIAGLNGSMHFFAKITAHPDIYRGAHEVGKLSACNVRIDIPAPGIEAYSGYETLKEAEKVIADIHGTTMKGHVVAAHLHNGLPKAGPFTVKFEGLPYQTTDKKVRTFGGMNYNSEEPDVLLGHAAYKCLADATNVLQKIFEEYGNVISLDFANSPPVNGRIRGIVRFASTAGAATACSALNGRRFVFLGSERIYLDHLHKLTYKTSSETFVALREDLRRLQSFARGQPGVQMTMTPVGAGETEIELSGSHLDSLKKVKTPLERMIEGEVLVDRSSPVWDNFFSTASGNSFIDATSKATHVRIFVHHARCLIRLWGTPAAKEEARELIMKEVRRLRSKSTFSIPLSGKPLFHILFNSLESSHESLSKDDVSVDFAARRLVIRGTNEQFKQVVASLNRSLLPPSNQERQNASAGSASGQQCPICLDVIIDGVRLKCGHEACKSCITRYLVSASDHNSFPLKCLGNGSRCPELIALPLCRKLLQKDQFSRLVDASFMAYIQTRPQEFHYCPTPDCPQIYRKTPGVVLQCPSCLIRICPSCHAMQHDGEECLVTNEASERLFREWKDAHNVKTCPHCSANIEKIAGCNHLTCTRCSTHICWACIKTFQAASDVYEHMVKAHGGIGL